MEIAADNAEYLLMKMLYKGHFTCWTNETNSYNLKVMQFR
jgi:hypothetical protein